MRTGIFGGSFNPVHNGHVHLAEKLLRAAHLDEVWLMVTPQNPWKVRVDMLDDDKRLRLVRAAVEGIDGLVASDYEFHLPKPSYTWDTLQSLSRDFPDREFVLLIGGDNWAKFNGWYAHEKILAHYQVAVYPRTGYPVDPSTVPQGVTVLRTRLINVSSTEIRERLRQGLPVDHLVPPRVAEMLSHEDFYKSGKGD